MKKEQLPIYSIIPQFTQAVRSGKDAVITAPTGSGKSTQIPQALLDSNAVQGIIVIVQPRRVACRAIARRVAEERGVQLGREVGYVVRYDAQRSSHTQILFVTDGVLIRFLEENPDLSWAGAVVFDEFHERRALGDIALGLLKQAQRRRASLRLIAMSATIRTDRLLSYLNAVSLTTDGRTYPVEIHHLPTIRIDQMARTAAEQAVAWHNGSREGDILVFMPGKEEIERTIREVVRLRPQRLTILPLHGELPRADQDRVFLPIPGRKLIVATNIAETSVTIPGVTTVIDTGYERRSAFDAVYGLERMMLRPISKMSAEQRAGRAGREQPGICIRLWSKEDHANLSEETVAEIHVADLSSVALTLKSVGVSDPAGFNFLDPPDLNRLRAAEEFLWQLGALDADRSITPIGWKMVRLPLSPRYARMVVEAERSGCLKKLATIAALMSGQPIFQHQASLSDSREKQLAFAADDSSDFFSLLELYRRGWGRKWSEEWCHEHGIQYDAVQEAKRLRKSIMRIAERWKTSSKNEHGNPDIIRRCLMTGLIDRIAVRESASLFRLHNGLSIKTRVTIVAKASLVAFGELRAMPPRGPNSPDAAAAFAIEIQRDALRQLAPHLVESRRVPVEINRARRTLLVQTQLRIHDLILEDAQQEVGAEHLFEVLHEQEERALRLGWHRVVVLPGIGGRSLAEWGGKRIPVKAERPGPHWASVQDGPNPTVFLHEPIVVTNSEPKERTTLPSDLGHRLTKLAPALARLRESSR